MTVRKDNKIVVSFLVSLSGEKRSHFITPLQFPCQSPSNMKQETILLLCMIPFVTFCHSSQADYTSTIEELYKDARFILYGRMRPIGGGKYVLETVQIPNCEGYHGKEVSVHEWPSGKGNYY